MSDVQNTTAAPATTEATVEKVMTNPTPAPAVEGETVPAVSETTPAATDATKPEETVAAPATTEEKVEETAATEAKVAEPLLEGQLGYKAPGLLKQFTFSKKEFWLNDAAVTPQNLGLYLRGEKSEVSHPVTAWASQTGKGLLFFNKKGESDRTQPAGVIPLYEATDLKSYPHEFTFDIHGHKHSFKANNDAERDGWYQSIEKSIELGKASKESVRDSEGYKAEIEKLNTPVVGGAVAASKTRSQSQPKKSTEVDSAEPKRTGSSDGEDEEAKKKNKSRSTSRGMLNRLKGKKEEAEVKKEEKKEEKEAVKEEKAAEKEEKKAEESTPVVAAAAPVATDAPVETATAEPAVVSPAAEEKPIEALPVAAETKTEEKPKVSKRGSIFGKIPGAWGSLKSPSKEKGEKEAELKPEVPVKDAAVSDAPPQLPETATAEPIETTVVGDAPKTEVTEPTPEAAKTNEVLTPNKEKKNFLSGLSFMNKRDRSVSPSAAVKDQPKTEAAVAAPVVPAKDETVAAEPVKAEEPVVETAAPATTTEAEKPVEKVEEPKVADATSPNGNKRSSMLGNLGRRASKALNRMQPKKENAAPTSTEKKVEEETTAAAPVVADKKADETEPAVATAPETVAERATATPAVASTTEENKPEAVVNQPTPAVAASA